MNSESWILTNFYTNWVFRKKNTTSNNNCKNYNPCLSFWPQTIYSFGLLMFDPIHEHFHRKSFVLAPFILSNSELLTLYNKGAFTYDVRCFGGIFDLPTFPNQILYYISLFSKIRWSLIYLPTYLKIWRHIWMLPYEIAKKQLAVSNERISSKNCQKANLKKEIQI